MKISQKEKLVKMLDGKRYCELNTNMKNIIKVIFPNVGNQDLIKSEIYKGNKIDLVVTIKNEKKNISLKNKNIICAYKGDIKVITNFLFSVGASYRCVLAILSYHYADGTNDGCGERLNGFGALLEENYKNDIEIVRECLDKNMILKIIDFLLVKEKNNNFVDYFYFGNLKYGEVISSQDLIYNIVSNYDKEVNRYMKIGPFNLVPLSRCDNYVCKNKYMHKCVLKINLYKYKKIIEK